MPRTPARLAALLLATALSLGCSEDEAPSCPSGQTACGGACKDTLTDETACGGCGILCAQGASCENGLCRCPAGQEICSGKCVDKQTDAQHCGACGNRCTLTGGTPLGACVAGGCVCDPGTSCPALDPECRDLQTDPTACGACDRPCTRGGEICAGGACACPAAKPDLCDPPEVPAEICTDLDTDATSCGACGYRCATERKDAVCQAGDCVCAGAKPDACETPSPLCTDLDTDPAHCGNCATICPTGATCDARQCRCPAANPDICAATCVNNQTSTAHCGACGNACAAGQACKDGACCTLCPSGACQTKHSNGAGGFYYDCNPLGTYTATAAEAAARSWQPGGQPVPGSLPGCFACLGWQVSNACGVWCYGQGSADPLQGRMQLNTASSTCVCPGLGEKNWN